MKRHAERGQAVFETALFMPLILLGLFGMFLAVTESAMSERAQLGVRTGGLITTVQNPYIATSLYAMYGAIDGNDPDVDSNCNGITSDTSLLYTSRKKFWQPALIASPTTATCWEELDTQFRNGTVGYNFLTHSNFMRLTVATPIANYLSNGMLGGLTSINTFAAANFAHPGSIGDMMSCTYIGPAVKSSLEAGSYFAPLDDLTTSGAENLSVSVPLPTTLPTVISLPYPLLCGQTFAAQTAPPTAPPI